MATPSPDALHLLKTAASGDGVIMIEVNSGGTFVQASGIQMFDDPKDQRAAAHWRAIVDELRRLDLIRMINQDLYGVTDAGYKLAGP